MMITPARIAAGISDIGSRSSAKETITTHSPNVTPPDSAFSICIWPVDSIPQITRNTISTEATVTQQQSLLIGGHYFEQDTGDVNKIPFLADIPVVGVLFQEKAKENQRRQRLFMITPRIIELPRT